jgi:small basic protein
VSYVEIPRFVVVIVTVLFIALGGLGFAYLNNKYEDRYMLLGPVFFIYFIISLMLIGFSLGILPH